jgi:ribosomal protein L29
MKAKELLKISKQEREKKLEELKLELIKSRSGKKSSKVRSIKKIIARILTINKSENEELKKK